ncbi:MAG: methyltransferase [Coriobacteriia bacterium]|nr:methyltransferase [Coriobacteriia bacterium]MDZ4654949.1 methyltransferase [Coriobacteriia bacterium]
MAKSDVQALEFVALCAALGAASTGGRLSSTESSLLQGAQLTAFDPIEVREQILAGRDPLGERIIAMRSSVERRSIGQVFTPPLLVNEMVGWVTRQTPSRVVDCGCGTGRFAIAAAKAMPDTPVLAVDMDPIASLACRANASVLGLTTIAVHNDDFILMSLDSEAGRTSFIGNPPYVRHHQIPAALKQWAREKAHELGWARWSGLAGLHALFFMAVVSKSSPGDTGCLLTSSEWLDVNYGRAMRDALLNGAGGRSVHILRPQERAFEEAMVTASILCFERGLNAKGIRIQVAGQPRELKNLDKRGRLVSRAKLESATSWSQLLAPKKSVPKGLVPLGSYVRVSRGAVTGANEFFLLTRDKARELGLTIHCTPAITRAREVLSAHGRLDPANSERCLLVANPTVAASDKNLRSYLAGMGAISTRAGGVCQSRRDWYSVPLKRPPIVATYMGRGLPAFALNPDRMPTVNVVHGLYPKVALDDDQLHGLVNFLSTGDQHGSSGRTYQGGLRKYEPSEMEQLLVPPPDQLRGWANRES